MPHEEAVQLYGATDLFVFPTLNETSGISAVEAVLLGVPTIVSDITVLREVLQVEGASPVTFVAANDLDGWRRAIETLLAWPPPRCELQAFRRAIERKYSPKRMIDGYLELIRPPGPAKGPDKPSGAP
jgi:glycosyltransferase involved in cell wall biosynthesis